jgi:hypothetical protein
VEKHGRTRQVTDDNLILRTRYSCRLNKAGNTHSEYVILIALPQQQCLYTRALKLRDTYIAFLADTRLITLPTGHHMVKSLLDFKRLKLIESMF